MLHFKCNNFKNAANGFILDQLEKNFKMQLIWQKLWITIIMVVVKFYENVD